MNSPSSLRVAIIGAGPAGLTAGYALAKAGVRVTVFEADSERVGGIAKTVPLGNNLLDIGGHRFFSQSQEIENLWTEILGDDFLVRLRRSQIYYRKKFYSYPLKPFEALIKMGFKEAFLCGLSYLRAQLHPIKNPVNFEQWVTNQFGSRLFRMFFKTYTEKVWGIPSSEISADWASQRIKRFALKDLLVQPKRGETFSTFRYPKKGPGQMWERCEEKIKYLGGDVRLGAAVTACRWNASNRTWTIQVEGQSGQPSLAADHVISTAPLSAVPALLGASADSILSQAAGKLLYRDFLIVGVVLKTDRRLEDQWIYIHDPDVRMIRVQNFRAWSPEMVEKPGEVFLGAEYFCSEKDDIWGKTDQELTDQALRELDLIGLARKKDCVESIVVRQKKAYPIYDDHFKSRVDTIRAELESSYPRFYTVGRNGMHKYNNQDHSMMAALYVAKNILGAQPPLDPWTVNLDMDYIEEKRNGSSGDRMVPRKIS
jgi:protoporphyrinogen oxidase